MRRGERYIGLKLTVGALLLLVCLPLVYLIPRALSQGGVAEVLMRGQTLAALGRSMALGIGVAVLCVALAVPLGWLTHATDVPGRRVFRIVLNLPLAVPSYVGAFVVILVFAPGGWLAGPLASLGLSIYGPLGAVFALLFSYPYALLAVQAALARTDPRLWESARSLGATPWQAFVRVIVPGLRPAMAAGGLLVSLYAIGDFGAVSLTRYRSLSYLIYVRYTSLFDRGEATALSLLLCLVSTVLVMILLLVRGRATRALTAHGSHRPWPTIALGRWRWPSFALCAAATAAGVALPVACVTYWLWRGLRMNQAVFFPAAETVTTLGLGAGAAILIVGLALFPSLLGRYGTSPRHSDLTRSLVHVITQIGYALPGIVVALAMVSFATSHAYALYQTHALVLIAYVIRFFPLAIHVVDDAIASQNPGLFLAARSLGLTAVGAWRKVILPTIWPALAAGLLAVFIAVIKELPITLLLSPPDLATLATRIWSLTEDAYYAAVAPAVLILLALATAGLLLSPDTRKRRVPERHAPERNE